MSKHTPGPWELEIITGAYVTADGTHIADVHHGRTATAKAEGHANARLIAAAPELLEALCLAHDYLAGNGWDDDPRLDTIRAAIAKATGGEG
jgi:hypothetical protein